jgi:hypothetical protein
MKKFRSLHLRILGLLKMMRVKKRAMDPRRLKIKKNVIRRRRNKSRPSGKKDYLLVSQ